MLSANLSMLLVMLLSKSLIYIKNNKGRYTDPCGTSLKTDFHFETSPSTTPGSGILICSAVSVGSFGGFHPLPVT